MLLILSPSKTQAFDVPSREDFTQPVFIDRSDILIQALRKLSPAKLQSLMDISPKLSNLNAERYKAFHTPFTPKNAKPALLAFRGNVYDGIDADHYTNADFAFAQKHLRILSGLYGILRPLDLIQAYRLEMKIKLKTKGAKDLYAFWANRITENLNADLHGKPLINLASEEYFKAVQPKYLEGQIITPVFKEAHAGGYRVVALFAKRARGEMANFAIKNRITQPEHLKDFVQNGYKFSRKLSDDTEWVFTRETKTA